MNCQNYELLSETSQRICMMVRFLPFLWVCFDCLVSCTSNWRGTCISNLVSDLWGHFLASKWANFLHVTLPRNFLSRNFFCCFVFRFREITHAKVQVFLNQPWRQTHTLLILLFEKTKALFGRDAARKKTVFFLTLFVGNKRETSDLQKKKKYLGYVFLWSQRPCAKIELIWTS